MTAILPTEILRVIIQYSLEVGYTPVSYLEPHIPSDPGCYPRAIPGIKPSWEAARSLSVSSKTLRALTMEAWFFTIILRSPKDVEQAHTMFPKIVTQWARQLCCHPENEIDVTVFHAVRKMFLNFKGLGKIDCVVRTLRQPMEEVVELDIINSSFAHPPYLEVIATKLPSLRVLRINQVTAWCQLCNIYNWVYFSNIPRSLVYNGGIGLPIPFARLLSPLLHLKIVEFSTLYSPIDDTDGNIDEKNSLLWSGECGDCLCRLPRDEKYRQKFIMRKRNPPLKPPSLDIVRWMFLRRPERELVNIRASMVLTSDESAITEDIEEQE